MAYFLARPRLRGRVAGAAAASQSRASAIRRLQVERQLERQEEAAYAALRRRRATQVNRSRPHSREKSLTVEKIQTAGRKRRRKEQERLVQNEAQDLVSRQFGGTNASVEFGSDVSAECVDIALEHAKQLWQQVYSNEMSREVEQENRRQNR